MKKIIISLFIFIAVTVGIFLLKPNTAKAPEEIASTQTVTIDKGRRDINVTASFTIITDSITRNFSNPKYHNQSEDVFITTDNSTQIHVTKEGIKWSDFFATLPMKLSKDCLITGDGETLCNKIQGNLKFYINGKENKDLLDKEIKQDDKSLIQFTSY